MAGAHHGQPVLEKGEPLERATAAMVLAHGRGATAKDILISCQPLLEEPGFAFLAPQAEANAWYPNPFTAPLDSNEPWLSAALDVIDGLLARIVGTVPANRVVLLGFSQGACLMLEYAARRCRRYGAVIGLSGALIGPPDTSRDYQGSLAGTPVFLGCGDQDQYVSTGQVKAAGAALRGLGGQVAVRLYPGMGHVVSADELAEVKERMAALTRRDDLGQTASR
jgi:predicted esterase